MKKLLMPIVLLFVILLSSCGDDIVIRICSDYFVAKVSYLSAPDTIFASDTLCISICGPLDSICHYFERCDTIIENNNLDITVLGKHDYCGPCFSIGMGYCTIINVTQLQIGIFYINVHQPDGTIWKDSVYVK